MIGPAAVVGSSIVLGPIATAIAAAYKMGSTVNEYINEHIETLKASDNPTISSSGRVLEGAKFGFGLGYVAPLVIIVTGQLMLGNTLAGVMSASGTVISAVTFTNPVAMTCAAVGAIYFGWTALSDSERNDILNRLSEGLNIGVELIKSFVGFVCTKVKDFSNSKQLDEFKDFVKTQAADFGKSLYDITKSVGDLMKAAAEKVSNIAGQAVDSSVSATKKAADAATQAAGTVSDAASEMAKSVGEKIKGSVIPPKNHRGEK
jgi:methyl-accepting chemotaxis protein